MRVQNKIHWVTATSPNSAANRAPRAPGVYAIGSVQRVADLPVTAAWAYVGRATGMTGLKGRLRQHEPVRERNELLRSWLLVPRPDVEIWFATTPSMLEAIELEAELILALDPLFNTFGTPQLDSVKEHEERGEVAMTTAIESARKPRDDCCG